jgi:predicted nucleic acid-binding protein
MLLDTDFLIWCSRAHPAALAWLDEFETVSLSVVTYMELAQGTRNKRELLLLQQSLTAWEAEILHLNEAVSMNAEQWVAAYFHSHALSMADALIAATAVFYRLPLVTADIKHFRVIPGLELKAFSPEI